MKKLTTLIFAILLTSSMAFAQDNTASTTTSGSYNTSDIVQDGSDNEATVTQSGMSNAATIMQGIQSITSNNDVATINQAGEGNSATLKSRDGWGGSPATISYSVDQQGNYNTAEATAFNGPATGIIEQAGSSNSAKLVQHTSDDMSAELSQSGIGNSATIHQTHGADNSVLQADVNGDYNTVDITQTNGAWQKLVLDVSGSSNTVTGTLGAHDADQFTSIEGNGNTFDFYQGKSNDAGVSISGDYNDVTLMQNGVGNMLYDTVPWDRNGIVVNGMSNTVNVTQNSDYNTATVNVSGVGNTSNITH
jgi:hypothetical protein